MKNILYFKGLNGLRALAALAVVFSHTTMGLHSFGLNPYFLGRYPDGSVVTTLLSGFGVSIFFALSGFLITYLLLNEKKASGEVNVGKFYIRRVLRIWPVYYLYVGLVVITLVVYNIHFHMDALYYCLLMAANFTFITGHALEFLYHYWSLGVEEQFYAFWPWIVKKSGSLLWTTIGICVSLILLKISFRLYDIFVNDGKLGWQYSLIHGTRFHCMLIGAIGAILYFNRNKIFLGLFDTIYAQLVCWIILLLVTFNKFHIMSFLDNEFISVVTVCIIIGQINETNRIVNLEITFLNFIGKISYGIYVIHPLVIFYTSKMVSFPIESNPLDYAMVYTLVFGATILLSYLSHKYFEAIFLKIKEKY